MCHKVDHKEIGLTINNQWVRKTKHKAHVVPIILVIEYTYLSAYLQYFEPLYSQYSCNIVQQQHQFQIKTKQIKK